MRLLVLVLAVFLSGYAHSKSDDSGQIFIDQSTARPPKATTAVSAGDDDDDASGSGVLSDESGSGSGTDETPTADVTVYTPSRKPPKKTTEKPTDVHTPKPTELHTEKSTENNEVPAEKGTKKPTTEGNNSVDDDEGYMVGGGVGNSKQEKEDEPDSKAVSKKPYQVLTVEVIAAIVVGAVCAIILIAFLVYRLRKRDEGSYALTDGGFNDTYKLRGEGKEAFV